jgi:hypothetical protein
MAKRYVKLGNAAATGYRLGRNPGKELRRQGENALFDVLLGWLIRLFR